MNSKTSLKIQKHAIIISVAFINILYSYSLGLKSDTTSSDTVYYTITIPPSGFDSYKANIVHGKTEVVSYYSSTVGVNRQTRIYLPPGYTADSTYNVLYLLHGIGGDINEWYNNGVPHYILDNLYAEGKIAPMIVILPNGRAMVDDSPGSNIFAPDKIAGFANFEFELIKDLIPFIDTTYSVKLGSKAHAIAGLSMGGGQSLNFGLAHLDTFAWVGAFSAAPNTLAPELLAPYPDSLKEKLSLLWISCGKSDGLLYISEQTHNYMLANNVPHVWDLEEGAHDFNVWKKSLYHFSQLIFQNYKIIPPKVSSTNNISVGNGFSFNPSTGLIIFSDNGLKNIAIYDINGRLLKFIKNYLSNELFVGNLNAGVYFVRMSNRNNSYINKITVF